MIPTLRSFIGLALILGAAACARPSELVVLLPDPDTGEVGKATVSAGDGMVHLDSAGQGTSVRVGKAPAAPRMLSAAELDRVFGAAMSARPAAPRHFVLKFEAGDTLTAASQLLLPEIVREVQRRASPEVSVIGHTDRSGAADVNNRVGLQRASVVRTFLLANGVDASLIAVSSHGESDPEVPTADGVEEARNRRVEVTVR